MMKKIISLFLALTFVLALSGCKNDKGRMLYNLDLEKYVELGEYKGIKVDTKSEDFDYIKKQLMLSDIENNTFEDKTTEGKVQLNDIANIDYVGKKDGVAFEGGTANGYNLTIGSGQFIPGFEEGLVDAKIGSTVDLKLTFPKDYQSTDLAGKDVVFTVKVNYVFRDFYKELGFETEEAYNKKLEAKAAENVLMQKVSDGAKVKEYPKKDKKYMLEQMLPVYKKSVEGNYGITFDNYLQQMGQTEDQFEEVFVTNYIEPTMLEQMALYAIFDKENMTLTDKEIEDYKKEYIASFDSDEVTEKLIKEYNGEFFFEYYAVAEKVIDFLYENAKIS